MVVAQVPAGSADSRRPRLSWVVGGIVTLGALGIGLLAVLQSVLPLPDYYATDITTVLILVGIAFLGEVIFVPLRRGEGWEQLTFNAAVVALAAMVVPPVTAIVASLIGVAAEEIILRRPLQKMLFNLGSYALSASALLACYLLIAGTSPLFSARSAIALVVGAVASEAINLVNLAMIWWAVEGLHWRQTWREEWTFTVATGIFGAGLAAVTLALLRQAPALTPFAALPAAALWYSFQSASRHTESRERSRWLVQLGQAVSTPAAEEELLPAAGDALRRIFGAEAVLIQLPGGMTYSSQQGHDGVIDHQQPSRWEQRALGQVSAQPTALTPGTLPPDWISGVGVRLDLADPERDPAASGMVLLGGITPERSIGRLLPWLPGQWELSPEDGPVLAALAASVASAIRAGQTMHALQEETAKLSAVVRKASDGIALYSPDGRFTMWSPSMTRITGVSAEAAAEHPPESLVAAIAAGPPSSPDGRAAVTFTRADGDERELDLAIVWFDDQSGGGESAIITVRDVTEQRRAERLKSDFISTVSHELRTPITPIKGYSKLLLTKGDKVTPEKRERMLQQINDRATQLAMLVEDLLLASRVSDAGADSARLSVDLQDVDACQIAESAVAGFPDLAERVSLELPGYPLPVRADPLRAGQCVSNLLSNAGKYSDPETQIQVRVLPADESSVPDGCVAISVTDRGRGIPAIEHDRVFRRFYRVEDPMTMTTGGNGLGLFIARELARAMDGDITLVSESGVGSTFTLLLRPVSGGNSDPGGATLVGEGGPP